MFNEHQEIGTYKLISKLGKGGFGEVWLAEKRSQFVTKKVAVKLPLDDQIDFEAISQEAELWEQASGHANVLPIIDADIIDGQVIIVSEYADGGSLADKLKRDGKFTVQKAVEMTIGILNGLEFLHNRKIIHRDIKPQNILLQGETPRLADFGISRAMQTTAISSTIIGTDAYMSPESFDGKRSVQTDIWAVGVVLYQLLVGSLPFPQEHPSERIFAILTKEFPPLTNEIPTSLQQIIAKALAKLPENRYQTANQMRMELQQVMVGIEHPTLAKTEVLQIPPSSETLTDVVIIDGQFKTGETETETVVNPGNIKSPAPTEPAFLMQSVVTQTPSMKSNADFKSLPTKAQNLINQNQNEKAGFEFLNFGFAIGVGFVALFVALLVVIFGANYFLTSQNSPQSKPASNLSSTSNSASNIAIMPNSASNISSTALMNIEMFISDKPSLIATVDGKSEIPSGYTTFKAQNSFALEYSVYQLDKFQLMINGKVIKLSKTPPLGGLSRFEVTKENLNQVLQIGSNENLPASVEQMNIELGVTEGKVWFELAIDGKSEAFLLSPLDVKSYTPQQSFNIRLYRGTSDKVQLKINNQKISFQEDQGRGGKIEFEITKDNLAQILQSGKISAKE